MRETETMCCISFPENNLSQSISAAIHILSQTFIIQKAKALKLIPPYNSHHHHPPSLALSHPYTRSLVSSSSSLDANNRILCAPPTQLHTFLTISAIPLTEREISIPQLSFSLSECSALLKHFDFPSHKIVRIFFIQQKRSDSALNCTECRNEAHSNSFSFSIQPPSHFSHFHFIPSNESCDPHHTPPSS